MALPMHCLTSENQMKQQSRNGESNYLLFHKGSFNHWKLDLLDLSEIIKKQGSQVKYETVVKSNILVQGEQLLPQEEKPAVDHPWDAYDDSHEEDNE